MLRLSMIGFRKIHFGVLAVLLAMPLAVAAQVTTATIVGTVSDPSTATVPGAQVTARNVDTGLTRTATSGDGGAYRLYDTALGRDRDR